MWRRHANLILLVLIGIFVAGCNGALLPSSSRDVRSRWESFDDAKESFDQIKAYETTVTDLERLGFDPFQVPNIQLLTYLEVIHKFMPNNSIEKTDLDEGVQECLAAKDRCRAYEIHLLKRNEDRFGNVFLDLFGFRRKTQISGWEFTAFIVIREDMVVYKIWGGTPKVDELVDEKKPLGPFQDLGGSILREAASL